MKGNWKEVKKKIEEEIDVIWKNEPLEVKASSRGLFPSRAGSWGMATGNLVSQLMDTYVGGFGSAAQVVDEALKNESFSLEQCRTLFITSYQRLVEEMGAKSKNGAAWLNMPKAWKFYNEIVESLDSLNSKEEFASLIWSWKNYLRRLNIWFVTAFNWEVIGTLRVSKQLSDYEDLLCLTRRAEVYMKAAKESKI